MSNPLERGRLGPYLLCHRYETKACKLDLDNNLLRERFIPQTPCADVQTCETYCGNDKLQREGEPKVIQRIEVWATLKIEAEPDQPHHGERCEKAPDVYEPVGRSQFASRKRLFREVKSNH
jgi:hypothetical protein